MCTPPTETQLFASVDSLRSLTGVVSKYRVSSIRPGVVIVAEFRGPDEGQARADVTQRVASECGVVPSDVILVRPGALPRTSSGKLRRLEVKRDLGISP